MGWSARSDVGVVAAGDYSELVAPDRDPSACRGVLVLHGGGPAGPIGTRATQPLLPGSCPGQFELDLAADVRDVAARAPYAFLSTDHGGSHSWGHDLAIAGVDAAYAALVGTVPGAGASSKVALFAVSMGGITAANWAARNPTLVAGVIGFIPASDLAHHRGTDADPNLWYDEINLRYGGDGRTPDMILPDRDFAAVAAAHDPMALAGQLRAHPTWLHYQDDDPWVPAETVRALATAIGTTAAAVSAGDGAHAAWTMTADDLLARLNACNW